MDELHCRQFLINLRGFFDIIWDDEFDEENVFKPIFLRALVDYCLRLQTFPSHVSHNQTSLIDDSVSLAHRFLYQSQAINLSFQLKKLFVN